MIRSLAVLTTLAFALPAHAHFIWLAPHEGGKVRMVFSDDTTPDAGVSIAKIAQTLVQIRTGDKSVKVDKTLADDHYLIAAPAKGPAEIGATCEYGILAKNGPPFLLCYYAKTLIGPTKALGMGHPLEIFPVDGKNGTFEVRWQKKPAADVEIVVEAPGQDMKKLKTDAVGQVTLAATPTPGLLGLRAKFVETKAGERDGKAFQEVRHYATLTVTVGAAR